MDGGCVARTLCAAAIAAAFAGAGRAETAAPGPDYPLTARLKIARPAAAARFHHTTPGGTRGPPNPTCVVEVGEQARRAFALAVAELFRTPAQGAADLDIAISSVTGDVELRIGGWHALVEHGVAVRDPARGELARWTFRSAEPIRGLGEASIPGAFERAARASAGQFEAALRETPSVVAWLAARGLRPPPAKAPPIEAPEPPRRDLPRSDRAAYVDVGGGFSFAGEGGVPALVARAGLAAEWFFVQVAAQGSSPRFQPQPVFGYQASGGVLRTTGLGVEGGPALRLHDAVELRVGAGAMLLWGAAEWTYEAPSFAGRQEVAFSWSRLAPTAFAAFQSTFSVAPVRVRLALEVRRTFRTSVDFPELRGAVEAGSFSGAVLVGVELPSFRGGRP